MGDESDHQVLEVDSIPAKHAPGAHRSEMAKDLTKVFDKLTDLLHVVLQCALPARSRIDNERLAGKAASRSRRG